MRTFRITFVLSIALIVGGFFCPPIGVIDGSVLTAVGLLLMFGVIAQISSILDAVRNCKSIKLQKGDISIDVHSTGSVEPSANEANKELN